LFRKSRIVFKYQSKVVKLLDIPNYQDQSKLDYSEWESENGILSELKELKLRDVEFSYSEEMSPSIALDGELNFLPGKIYGVTGQNKSGKTTLARLICRIYPPDYGKITINGVDYEDIPRIPLRDFITLIPQKPFIFAGTLRDNIKIGNPNATEEEVFFAAQKAGVIHFLTQGETLLSDSMSSIRSENKIQSSRLIRSQKKYTIKKTEGIDDIPVRTVSYDQLSGLISPTGDVYRDSYSTHYPLILKGESEKEEDDEKSETSDETESNEETSDLDTLKPKSKTLNKINFSHLQKNEEGVYPILNQNLAYDGADCSPGFAQTIALARLYVRKNQK